MRDMARHPSRRRLLAAALTAAFITAGAFVGPAAAAPGNAHIALALRASGLSKPVYVTTANDGTGRLFIVEQEGRIRVYKNGAILPTPFLSIVGQVTGGTERGLLGLAFHPSFKTNRKFYIYFTDIDGNSRVREYLASTGNPDVAQTSYRTIMLIYQPYTYHKAGNLQFGKGGYLFIPTGDGGGAGDPGNRAQSIDTLLGKILRIDVDHSTATKNYTSPSTNPYAAIPGRNEIWQLGLRNPWRISFDRLNGDLWIADVGQEKWEEIDRAVKTISGPGRGFNWGWRVMEGTHCYLPSSGCNRTGKKLPVVEYAHDSGRCAVVGGYVYRGAAIPALYGGYLFGDFCTGEVWVITASAPAPAPKTLLLDTDFTLSSFGQDAAGELYVLDYGNGRLYQVVAG